ncbi:hypothetical protein F9U64_04880 [Gracilibacillus oryzae]|uniref:Heptaprenyl diphosphate synthase n=1 Tax=Gracilibacillus oryzae TaxID=1672701 RepID=A0A7C8KRS7_9BACI|nr:heptaprenyl diphosphate synthase component 1 [Gracilibacillus oryzae]KAB8138487.1 hypothetical protein F9U64_04880 [Gracilibacillus oryzae]
MKSKQLINYYKKRIHKNIKQDYLFMNLEQPDIEEYKLFALHAMTSHQLQKDHYIVSTMIVQLALNTHDQIFRSFPQKDKHLIKNQQLTVLAGDFYSGIYYQLLAKAKDISFVRQLAKGINEMTQQKAFVYYQQFDDIETFLQEYEKIETALLNKVATYFELEQGIEYMGKWILFKKLQLEWWKFKNSGHSFFQDLLLHNVGKDMSVNELESMLFSMIDLTIKKIKNYQKKLPPQFDMLIQNFQHEIRNSNLLHVNSVLEEGLSK